MHVLRQPDRLRCATKAIAAIAFGAWLAWNVMWLARGQLPPSALRQLAGLPVPTTGMTRAVLALGEGRWLTALCFSPLGGVYLLLTAVSLMVLVRRWRQRTALVLPRGLAVAWATSLAAGWLLKFLIGPRYW